MANPDQALAAEEQYRDLAITGALLGVVAARAYGMQHSGVTEMYAQPLKAIVESGAHPAVGFGAAAVTLVAANRLELNNPEGVLARGLNKFKYAAVLAAGTVANFTVEAAQDVTVRPEAAFYSDAQHFETAKDWLFALGGVTLAYAITRFRK